MKTNKVNSEKGKNRMWNKINDFLSFYKEL